MKCKCGHYEEFHTRTQHQSGRWRGRFYNYCVGNCKCKKFEAKEILIPTPFFDKPKINYEYKRGYDDGVRHRDKTWREAIKKLKEELRAKYRDPAFDDTQMIPFGKVIVEIDKVFGFQDDGEKNG